jgi:hypothetical protein
MSAGASDGQVGAAGPVFGIDSLNQASWVDALSRNMSALLADKVQWLDCHCLNRASQDWLHGSST